ncbi:MAG: cytochrome c oxidase subunit 3 [Bacteroidetes bacterium]|nr:cytochrome c oxidase subunit 3 [Bacteroidota bacterium]
MDATRIEIDEEMRQARRKAAKNLLWLGIVGMVMLFGGFTSAYVVRHEKGDWLDFTIPPMFFISTAIIIVSSITMNWAVTAAKDDNLKNIKSAMLLTLLLGIAFAASQYLGWKNLVEQKVYFAGRESNASGSFFYMITFMHLLHLFGGIIAVIVVNFKALAGKYSSKDYLGIQLCAIYWHFLDALWIYLFLFLYLIR